MTRDAKTLEGSDDLDLLVEHGEALLALTLALGAMGFDVLSIIGAVATGLATVGVFSRGGDDDDR